MSDRKTPRMAGRQRFRMREGVAKLLALGLIAFHGLLFLMGAQTLEFAQLRLGFPVGAEELFTSVPFDAAWPLALRSITYALVHGSFAHVLFNAAAIAYLGTVVALAMGNVRFLLFCVLTATGGALGQLLLWPQPGILIGASGVVFGLAAARSWCLAMIERKRRARLLRLAHMSMGWMLLNLLITLTYHYSGMVDDSAPVVAWRGHLGGYVAGLVAAPFLLRIRL